MTERQRILIFDDEESKREQWETDLTSIPLIQSNFEVRIGEPTMLFNALTDLEERRKNARTGKVIDSPNDSAREVFDEVDILIIDYDLLNLPSSIYLTGESIAYLSRSYSKVGLIVALNQFDQGRRSFDLTLKGHPESFADLNISDHFLSNLGLWTDQWSVFRPWTWPILSQALERYEVRVKELMPCLDTPIVQFLGFPESLISGFSRSTIQFLTEIKGIEKVTFRQFVTESENGLRRKDKPSSEDSIARIAAARVAHWLTNLVLSGQDILIDAPHLISHYPSLIKGDSQKLDNWNRVATFKPHDEVGINHIMIDQFRFKRDSWLSSPVWFWHEIRNYEKIVEVKEPWSINRPDYVFCEDISRFVPLEDARGFVADVQSPFARRFVKQIDDIDYRPRVRFSL